MNLCKYISVCLVLGVFCAAAAAQTRAQNPWVQVNADGDFFQVSMPHQPKIQASDKLTTNYGEVEANGRIYLASANGATYSVWALTNVGAPLQQPEDLDNYLDGTAELVWEGLLKTVRDALADEQKKWASMSYTKELNNKPIPGREYSVTVGNTTGTT